MGVPDPLFPIGVEWVSRTALRTARFPLALSGCPGLRSDCVIGVEWVSRTALLLALSGCPGLRCCHPADRRRIPTVPATR
jgi:hypothetical protein